MSTIEVGFLWAGHPELKVLDSGSTYESWSSGPSHVDGVGVKREIYNASDKDIKNCRKGEKSHV